ncbi:phenylacetate--CoA ligase family protein [Selenomonas montiformis]|uniref:Phenylacetate--CoA ligase n=2 Tax=Selenomonas montiformis TaxID=2652285 RepID=A0A6I2URS1_9FIRM|nr:phenylacetate--CoA ligase [Selenomonas montiformis]
MYANPQIEQMNRSSLQRLQLERLKKQVKWAQEKSRFYQERFRSVGVSYTDIHTLEDISRLPLTERSMLARTHFMDWMTMPLSGVLRVQALPEEGESLTRAYTNGDIAHNVEMMTRCLTAAGVMNASLVAVQGDLSDSRLLDIQYALEILGAAVVPMGTDYHQWLRMLDMVGADTLVSTPHLVLQLVIQLQTAGRNIVDSPLKRILCWSRQGVQDPLRRHIQERTQARLYDLYGPAELGTAGILYQCEAHNGYHIQEDYYYPEIVDFHSDHVIHEPQHMGELVLTSLAAEAMPLIRYRTGQAAMLEEEPCSCGRTLRRIITPLSAV